VICARPLSVTFFLHGDVGANVLVIHTDNDTMLFNLKYPLMIVMPRLDAGMVLTKLQEENETLVLESGATQLENQIKQLEMERDELSPINSELMATTDDLQHKIREGTNIPGEHGE
jgi:hypothetical protein